MTHEQTTVNDRRTSDFWWQSNRVSSFGQQLVVDLWFSEKVHGRQNILQIHSLGSTGRQKKQHNRTTVAFPNPFFSFTALQAVRQNSKIPNPFLSLHSYLGYQKEQQKSNKTNSQMSYSKSIPLASQLFRLSGGTAKINQNRYLVAWLAQPILILN